MRCPNCGNEIYERLGECIVQCTRCWSLWDAEIYPGFPRINVEPGRIWDTRNHQNKPDIFPGAPIIPLCSICGSNKHTISNHQTCMICGSHEHSTLDHWQPLFPR